MLLPPYDPRLIIDPLSDDEIGGVPGAVDPGEDDIDPVVFSVVYARLDGILSEMTETILTTARNPILYGAKDFTCPKDGCFEFSSKFGWLCSSH